MESINLDNFTSMLESANKPVFVDFYTTWCGPCKLLKEYLKTFENNDKYIKIEVNAESVIDIVNKYNITSVPTIIIFENGQEINRLTGFNKNDVNELFN